MSWENIEMGFKKNPSGEIEKDPDQANNPYAFDLDQNCFPVFSDKNLLLVWSMVENNSSYNAIDEKTVKGIYTEALEGDEEGIVQAVYLTDNANTTHLASLGEEYSGIVKDDKSIGLIEKDGKEIDLTEKYAKHLKKLDYDKDEFRNGVFLTASRLVDHADKIIPLIREGKAEAVYQLAHYAETYIKEKYENQYESAKNFSRNNFSFASKFCHYACVNSGYGDKYCIYDSVVGDVLPYYIWMYADHDKLKDLEGEPIESYSALKKMIPLCKENKSAKGYECYREYYKSMIKGIDKWRDKYSNGKYSKFILTSPTLKDISDNGIGFQHVDRLIWYYFKVSVKTTA